MQSDGSVIIDTKMLEGGLEKGFEALRNEMETVGVTAEKTGEKIKMSFSKMDVSKPISAAADKVKALEEQLAYVTSEAKNAKLSDDDQAAMRLENQRIRLYDQLEAARQKLVREVAAAAKKEADLEAKEAARATQAKQKEAEKQQKAATKPLRRFSSRLKEIAAGALVFNLLSAGLREVTKYFGSALKSNKQFTAAVAQLKGALMTAFQPIYEAVLPALLSLMRVLTAVIQVIGQFFAMISGKSTAQMASNAKALNKEADAIKGVGGAAKKAKRELAKFDEINKLGGTDQGGGGGGGAGSIAANFEPMEITDGMEHLLYLIGAIGAGLLTWKIASAFTYSLSLIAGLALAIGGAVLYAFNIFDAFKNGIDWNNLTGMLLGMIAIAGGLFLAFGAVGAGIGLLVTGVLTAIVALREWITTGELSNEACVALVLGIAAIGAAISLLTGSWIPLLIAAVAAFVLAAVAKTEEFKAMLSKINDWLQNVFQRDWTELFGTVLGTQLNVFFAFCSGIWQAITEILSGVIDFIAGVFTGDWQKAWTGVKEIFKGIVNGIIGVVNGLVRAVVNGVNSVIRALNRINVSIPSWVPGFGGKKFGLNLKEINAPQIPYLAQGAVIPPNAPFMAMLGDQRHGTNIEAPLSTIQEAVATVMEDYAVANLAGHEATVAVLRDILEAVLGIEIGDEMLSKAANRYNTRLATMRGDA